MPYEVWPVTLADAPGVARANMSAFYGNAHWRLLWPNMSLDEIIDGNEKRLPRNLVRGRATKRHQMVVDTSTGEVVGYARWILPKDSAITWLEAQVPEPSPEEEERFEASWKSASEGGRPQGVNRVMVDEMSGPLEAEEEAIIAGNSYICKKPLTSDFVCHCPDRRST
jgi:hypothetical protein